MKKKLKIQVNQRGAELQIEIHGAITPKVGAQLTLVMGKMYKGYGTVLVNTAQVTRVTRKSRSAIARLIRLLNLPQDKIFYQGRKAFIICHDIKQVIPSADSKGKRHIFDVDIYERLQCKASVVCEPEFLWEEQSGINRYQIT